MVLGHTLSDATHLLDAGIITGPHGTAKFQQHCQDVKVFCGLWPSFSVPVDGLLTTTIAATVKIRCMRCAVVMLRATTHACSNRIPASYKSRVLQDKSSLPDLHSSSQHTMSTAPFLNEYFTSQCPASAPFFSFMGAAIALVFSSESSFLSQLTWSLTSFSQTLAPLTAHPKLALAS